MRKVESYRGFEIRLSYDGPWSPTYHWGRKESWLSDPMGCEPSVAGCRRAIDAELDGVCTACNGTGQVRVDPFNPADLAHCHCEGGA